MLVIGIFGSYQTAQAAEIVAGYTALEVIEGILLSFGQLKSFSERMF